MDNVPRSERKERADSAYGIQGSAWDEKRPGGAFFAQKRAVYTSKMIKNGQCVHMPLKRELLY